MPTGMRRQMRQLRKVITATNGNRQREREEVLMTVNNEKMQCDARKI